LISPDDLGPVLPHEHLLLDFHAALQPPPPPYTSEEVSDLDFQMENMGIIRQFPYSVKKNLVVDEVDVLQEELVHYKKAGGGTLVDVTTHGIRLDPSPLPHLAQESGVNIVCGTGFYVDATLEDEIKAMDVRERCELMVKELTEGIGETGIKAGVIGEMGCSYPLTAHEKISLQAAALAQKQTGAPLIIHPGRDSRSPIEIMDVLMAEGAEIGHTVMSHLDRTFISEVDLVELARRGCYLEYDLFGIECSYYQFSPVTDMPSDAQRIQWIKLLVDQGFERQVVMAHDVHTKHRLVKYGGHGYGHILRNILPEMLNRGFSEGTIKTITQDNPQKWLQFH
jgi:phosphotriesterase-related protein